MSAATLETETTDWTAAIEQYRNEGYCIIRGLLTPDERKAVLARLEQAVMRRLSPKIYVQVEPGKENESADPSNPWKYVRKAAWLIRNDSFFQQFVAKDKYVSLAKALMGVDDIRCMGDEAQLKPPRVGSAHPWHQDQPYYIYTPGVAVSGGPPTPGQNQGGVGLTHHFATCWVALDPATKANGCMQVIPSSHKRGIIPRRNPQQAWFDNDEIDTSGAVHAVMEPGDALWFDSLTLHGSDRNETDHPRRSFIFRYVDVHNLPKEQWPVVRQHGVLLDDPDVAPIFRPPAA